jgi:hypothetical protein
MGIHVSRGVEVKNYCRSRGSLPFSPPTNLLEGGREGPGMEEEEEEGLRKRRRLRSEGKLTLSCIGGRGIRWN